MISSIRCEYVIFVLWPAIFSPVEPDDEQKIDSEQTDDNCELICRSTDNNHIVLAIIII